MFFDGKLQVAHIQSALGMNTLQVQFNDMQFLFFSSKQITSGDESKNT
jgi:hypothetical protein